MPCKSAYLLLASAALVLASAAPAAVPINDIQAYDPVTFEPASPYHLVESILIEGVVTVTDGTYHPNIIYLQDETGGTMVYLFDVYEYELGDRLALEGVVVYVEGEIRFNTQDETYLGGDLVPPPIDLSLADMNDDTENIGALSRISGTVTEVVDNTYFMTDGADTAKVFVSIHTGIDMSGVAVGDHYTAVGPVTRRNGVTQLKPRDQADMLEGPSQNPGPVVLSYDNTNWAPRDEDGWEMTFMVEDDSGLDGATFRYRIVEDGPAWTEIHWTPGKRGRGVYPVTFSGASAGKPSKIEWTFGAEDDSANVVALPQKTFAAGTWLVSEFQQVDPCDPDQSSPLAGEPVNIEGVVCAVGDNHLVLVDSWDVLNKGVYPVTFSGASAGKPSRIDWVYPGDEIRLGGEVVEVDDLTTIVPHMESAIMLLSFGNDLPEPPRVHTGVLADDSLADGDCIKGEAYESVWVRPWLSLVTSTDNFALHGTYRISSTGDGADGMEVLQPPDLLYVPEVGDVVDITGYLTYTGTHFQLVTTGDEYVMTADASDVPGDHLSDRMTGFVGIAPNPFNPTTEIRFRLEQDDLTQLNIYDLRGELVTQLVNERLAGGVDHVRSWDGTDQQDRSVGSGVYFARLRIGTNVHEVRELTLVK